MSLYNREFLKRVAEKRRKARREDKESQEREREQRRAERIRQGWRDGSSVRIVRGASDERQRAKRMRDRRKMGIVIIPYETKAHHLAALADLGVIPRDGVTPEQLNNFIDDLIEARIGSLDA